MEAPGPMGAPEPMGAPGPMEAPALMEAPGPTEAPGPMGAPGPMARRTGASARGGHRRRIAASVAAAMLAAGVGGFAPHARASDEATFIAAYNAAAKARKAVGKAGFEWRDVRAMLRESRKLGEKGEYGKAVELANRVRRQCELGLIQAKEQESAWKDAVLK